MSARLFVLFMVLTQLGLGAHFAAGQQVRRLPELTEVHHRLESLEDEVRELRRQVAENQEYSPHSQEAGWMTSEAPALGCEGCPPAEAKKEYPTVRVTGFFQLDSAWFNQDPVNIATVGDIQDGVDFRRARLAATGKVEDWVSYMIEFDFSPSVPLFVDLWMNFSDIPLLGNVRIGRWRQPFGMTELTSVKELPFLERPLPFALSPFRQTGIGFYDHASNERATWAASVFRYPCDNFGGNVGDNGGYGFSGRATWLPYYECDGDRLVHLGVEYWSADPSLDTARFASQPEIQVVESLGGLLPTPQLNVPPFVDTGFVPTNNVSAVGLEFAAAMGRFYVQSEARWLTIDQIGGPSQTVEGAYVETRYVLTGEKIPYNTATGVFGRIVPFCDVHPCGGGIGAWELAARWSHLDLDGNWLSIPPAAPGPGRRLTDLTLGMNWYLNGHTKFQFNYIHAFLDDPTLGNSDADIFALRGQVDF